MTGRAHREQQLISRDDGDYCFYCGTQFGQLDVLSSRPICRTFDHIIPVSAGGTGRLDNFVLACERCNIHRGSKPFPDFCQGTWLSEQIRTTRDWMRERGFVLRPLDEVPMSQRPAVVQARYETARAAMKQAEAARQAHLYRRQPPTVTAMASPYGYDERPVYTLVRLDP